MEERNIKVLLIEDNQDDAELLQRTLAKSVNGHFTVTPAKCLKDGLEKLSGNSHDLILSDLGLPDSHGLDTVTQVLQMAPDIPLVVLSGYDDESVAIKAVQLGAQDYMVKGQMDGTQMERSLSYAVERFRLQRELEQHTQEISKIQANLLKILDKNADAIIVVSKDKQILFINPAAESLFRCNRKALLNTPFTFPVEGGKTSEIDIKRQNGEKTTAEMRVVDIDWEGMPAYLASLRDVTEQKKAGEKLRESEERLKKYLEGAPDGVYINNVKGTLLYGNKKAEVLTGYKKEELIGSSFLKNNILPAKYLAKAGKLLALSVMGKPTGPDEFELNRKDGSRIWVEITSTPIKQEGELLIIGFVRDITERKRTEALIQQQKDFLTNTFESLTHPFYVVDANDYTIQMANKATRIDSSSGAVTCYSRIHNQDRPCSGEGNVCPLEEVKSTKEPVVLAHIHSNAKGKIRNIEVHGYPLFDAQGNVVQMIEYCLDITERKQAEFELHERIKELRCLYDVADISGNPENALDERYQKIADKLPQGWQYPEITCVRITMNNEEYKTENYRETEWKQSSDIIVQGEKVGMVEVSYLKEKPEADEGPFCKEERLLINAVAERLGNITEGKQAEDALRESEEKSRVFMETADDLMNITDKDGMLTYVNDSMARTLGYSKEELIGMHITQLLSKESLEKDFNPNWGKFLTNGEISLETTFLTKEGKEIYCELKAVAVYDSDGNSIGSRAVHRDITERKRADEALRESEEKFSKAFRSSPDMIVITTVKDGTFVEVNDSFTENTGYTRKEVIGHRTDEVKIWANKEDRLRMIGLLKEQGKVCQEEYEFRMKSGKTRLWLFSAEQISIGDEECIISITIDITERKETEEALRFSDAAFKSIHESVIATDTNFTITHWNEISEQIYGIKASQAIGKTLQNVIEIVEKYPGENGERFNNLNTNGYLHEEQLHRTRHGEVWVDVSFQAIGAVENRYGWVVLATAITQRKLAEEALKRSEEKYRELISTSMDGIISMDQNMRIIIWNQGAERIFGYKEKEVLGKPVIMLTPEKNRKKAEDTLTKLFKINGNGDSNQIAEAGLLRKNGTVVPVEISLSKRKAEENYLITGIVRDITVRKEAEEKLRQVDQMKSEFLSNISHELRTPLQSIGGFAKLILEGKVPDVETQQEFLEIIDRESQQLGVLINSLLDMSRLESGRFQINKRLLPLRDTFIDSIKIFHSLARDKDVSLGEDIPETLPEVEVDAERLRQVIVNLMSNAIKFSDPGGSVTAKLKTRNGELLFQVKDRGIGIDKKAISHVFERFYRAEDKLARGGTGLGLFISKQIIEAHGGRIWAKSKPGEGSTFSFTLPLNGKGGNGNGKKDINN